MSQWLEAITKLRRQRVEKPPKGWKSRAEIHAEIGLSTRQCDELVQRLVKAGAAERKMFLTESGAVVRPVPHYRLRKAR